MERIVVHMSHPGGPRGLIPLVVLIWNRQRESLVNSSLKTAFSLQEIIYLGKATGRGHILS
jgi:hypothetical protein